MKQRLTTYLTNPLLLLPALLIGLSIYVRLRYLNVPLERDEGEYAYMGQLLLDGIPPYLHAYTMKLPGVAMMYALFMKLFGQTTTGIHLGLLITNLLTAGLVYLLGRRLVSSGTGAVAAGYFALLSLSESVMGFAAHATHFVNLFVMAGLVTLLSKGDNKRLWTLFGSGLCFGLAVLMKQHAVVLLPFALYIILVRGNPGKRVPELAALLCGILIPYLLVAAWMLAAGVFARFWFWTVQYASAYAGEHGWAAFFNELVPQFKPILLRQLPIWLMAFSGIWLMTGKARWDYRDRAIIPALFALSFVMTAPGFMFRSHYFVLMLPWAALLAAHATLESAKLAKLPIATLLPPLILTAAALYGITTERAYLFSYTPEGLSRKVYGANPFPEAKAIGDYLRENSSVNDRIAILGSEPEILFYANRQSATGHIYMYGLMEKQKYGERMQAELIAEIEAANPLYLVVVHNSASWLLRSDTPNNILSWGDDYISLRYDEVGIIDSYSDKPGRFLWDSAAFGRNPDSDYFVSVFRRRW